MNNIPTWVAIIIGIAAVLTAVGTIWRVVMPMAELIVLQRKAIPLLRGLIEAFGETGGKPFKVLDEIVTQVRTNSGSSMKDTLNSLAKASKMAADVADKLRIEIDAGRQIAERDRDTLLKILDNLDRKVQQTSEQGDRMEALAAVIALDLDAAHERADKARGGLGDAADAASRSPESRII